MTTTDAALALADKLTSEARWQRDAGALSITADELEAAAALRDLAGAQGRAEKAEARVAQLEAALAEIITLPPSWVHMEKIARAALGEGGGDG